MEEGGSAAADEHVAGLANYVEKGGQQMEKWFGKVLCDRLPGDPSELEAFQKECLVVEIEEEAAAALRHLTVAQKYESEMGKPRRESRVE